MQFSHVVDGAIRLTFDDDQATTNKASRQDSRPVPTIQLSFEAIDALGALVRQLQLGKDVAVRGVSSVSFQDHTRGRASLAFKLSGL